MCLLGQSCVFRLCSSSLYLLQRSCIVTAGSPLFMSRWMCCQQAGQLVPSPQVAYLGLKGASSGASSAGKVLSETA